jgi:hypothetical protein
MAAIVVFGVYPGPILDSLDPLPRHAMVSVFR